MNNSPEHIDEHLRNTFKGFSPEAPDVWPGIEQGLANMGGLSGKVASKVALKGSLTGTKLLMLAAGAAAIAAAVISYVASTGNEQQPIAKVYSEITPARPLTQEAGVEKTGIVPVQKHISASRKSNSNASKGIEGAEKKLKQQKIQDQQGGRLTTNQTDGQSINQPAQIAATKEEEPDKPRKETEETSELKAQSIVRTENIASKQSADNKEKASWVYEEEVNLRVPGSFSPNGDAYNDQFVIEVENEEIYHLMILDRNGRVVFESDNKEKTWDGNYPQNGEKCEEGWYAYSLRYKVKGSEKERVKSGKFKLVR